jgi:hypothetical protein
MGFLMMRHLRHILCAVRGHRLRLVYSTRLYDRAGYVVERPHFHGTAVCERCGWAPGEARKAA